MPQLPPGSVVFVRTVRSVPPCHFLLKFCRVPQFPELERRPLGVEDVDLLREVPVIGVVQRILDEVANEHLDPFGWDGLVLQHIGVDLFECHLAWCRLSIQRALVIIPFVLRVWQDFFRPVLELDIRGRKMLHKREWWTWEATVADVE